MFKISLLFSLFFIINAKETSIEPYKFQQQTSERKFNYILDSGGYYTSKKRIRNYAGEGNAKHFLLLSYYVNSNNIMFEATKKTSYLRNNIEVIKELKRTGKQKINGKLTYRWLAKIKPNESNFTKNDKEFMLYEGYLMRYVGEYYYLLATNKDTLNQDEFSVDIEFLSSTFFKWYNHSIKMYGDDSSLQSLRTHMGSHWATLAMYLYVLDDDIENKSIYKSVFTKFDRALKNNLRVVDSGYYKTYQWNSTWDLPFTEYLHSRNRIRAESSETQDVSHGNHVVQYILDSFKLKMNSWTEDDIKLLCNTLKYTIWNSESKDFSDNVDGTRDGKSSSPGWKQSDGWMKLMQFDDSLYSMYRTFYSKNRSKIDGSSLNLQFHANFVLFEKTRL